jgi:hypothetical protein
VIARNKFGFQVEVPEDIDEGNRENRYGSGFGREIKRHVPLSARHHPAPLTAHDLHDILRERQFEHTNDLDADRRLIYIADLDVASLRALSWTADRAAQKVELRCAILPHCWGDTEDDTIPIYHRKWPPPTTREAESLLWRMENDDSDEEDSHRDLLVTNHRKLAHSVMLTVAQIVFTLPLQTYNLCHGKVPQDAHDALIPSGSCAYFQEYLPPYLELVEHNSTTFFVFSALAYGAVAMREYHINRQDRHQGIFLMVGLVAGFLACWDARQIVSSRIAFCISIALLTSACGHWVYAMRFGSRTEGQGAVKVEKEDGADAV